MHYVFIQFWVQRELSRNYIVHDPFVLTHSQLVIQQHQYWDSVHRDTFATINKPMLIPISTQNLLVTVLCIVWFGENIELYLPINILLKWIDLLPAAVWIQLKHFPQMVLCGKIGLQVGKVRVNWRLLLCEYCEDSSHWGWLPLDEWMYFSWDTVSF